MNAAVGDLDCLAAAKLLDAAQAGAPIAQVGGGEELAQGMPVDSRSRTPECAH